MRRKKKPGRRDHHPAPPPVVTPETVHEQRAAGLLSRISTLPLRPPEAVVTSVPPPRRASSSPELVEVGREPLLHTAPPSTSAPAEPTLPPQADVEATTVRPRHYDLRLPDGRLVPLSRRATVIGRRSDQPHPPPADADLVVIDDPGRSLSRHHVLLEVGADSFVRAVDLHSGNGTTLVSTTGEISELEAGTPTRVRAGSVLSIGDHAVTVVRRRPEPIA